MASIYARNGRVSRNGDEDVSFWGSVAIAATLLVLCALSATYARPPLEFHAPFEPTFVAP
jgi:hypothetical protein